MGTQEKKGFFWRWFHQEVAVVEEKEAEPLPERSFFYQSGVDQDVDFLDTVQWKDSFQVYVTENGQQLHILLRDMQAERIAIEGKVAGLVLDANHAVQLVALLQKMLTHMHDRQNVSTHPKSLNQLFFPSHLDQETPRPSVYRDDAEEEWFPFSALSLSSSEEHITQPLCFDEEDDSGDL